jgi:hypothetical protein
MKLLKNLSLIFFISLMLLTSGCLGFVSDDPNIAEVEMIKDVVVYSHSKDFTNIAGKLFEYDKDSGYFGIAFSHELGSPYDGMFFLGNQSNLVPFVDGDMVTIVGFIDDKNLVLWQQEQYYEIVEISYTEGIIHRN